jgi:hypothetical protein
MFYVEVKNRLEKELIAAKLEREGYELFYLSHGNIGEWEVTEARVQKAFFLSWPSEMAISYIDYLHGIRNS